MIAAPVRHTVPIAQLRLCVDYDPLTGLFVFRERPQDLFQSSRRAQAWNTRFAGRPAFQKSDRFGYRVGTVLNVRLFAHRAAWALSNERWPALGLDHINGERSDNRIVNLREVDHATNARNMALSRSNKSGITGVRRTSIDSSWQVAIRANGQNIHLGCFATLSEAEAVRKAAEVRYGYHPNHGRRIIPPPADTAADAEFAAEIKRLGERVFA